MNTKYSQNVTCVCKNIPSVKRKLLECPITTELFQKMDRTYRFQQRKRYSDVINSIVKLIVHSPVERLV